MKKTEEINRSGEFLDLANELSEFIGLLGLEKRINDKLVKRITLLIEQAEKDSYRTGLEAGMKYNFNGIKDRIIDEIESEIIGSETSKCNLIQ